MRWPDRLFRAAPAIALLLPLTAAPAAAMPSASPDAPPAVAGEYERVAKEVVCWCGCSRQSLYECTCGFSHSQRGEMEAAIASGKTSDDLIAGLVAEHGEQIRLVPQAKGFNLLAWIGPGIVILLSGVVVLWILLRWSSRPPREIRAVPSPGQEDARKSYRERLARDLAGLDR